MIFKKLKKKRALIAKLFRISDAEMYLLRKENVSLTRNHEYCRILLHNCKATLRAIERIGKL